MSKATELTEMPNSSFDKDGDKFIIYYNNEKFNNYYNNLNLTENEQWIIAGIGLVVYLVANRKRNQRLIKDPICYSLHKAKKEKQYQPQIAQQLNSKKQNSESFTLHK